VFSFIFHLLYFLKMIIEICFLVIWSDRKLVAFFIKKHRQIADLFFRLLFLFIRLFSFLTFIPNDCFTHYFSSFSSCCYRRFMFVKSSCCCIRFLFLLSYVTPFFPCLGLIPIFFSFVYHVGFSSCCC
jgi:hypothetical protein